jgi:nucleoside-diphosphate-sugar epimerase
MANNDFHLPEYIHSEAELDSFLAQPYPQLVELMARLDGDVMILGAGGKMGPSLAMLARRAMDEAGSSANVIAVSRFSDSRQQTSLEQHGVQVIRADLSSPADISSLPRARNIVFMAGQKFGLIGQEPQLWVMNAVVPGLVAQAFPGSRIVAFSTGCVYPLRSAAQGGSTERDEPSPIGEYANSCLGRERIFEYYAKHDSTPVLLFRLNYAIDLRYGVLFDIATRVFHGEPVDISVNAVNIIWQGDANNRALLALEHASVPAAVLNVTGEETLSVTDLAHQFGREFNREPIFTGSDAQRCYLSDSRKSIALFGAPKVPLENMISYLAEWLKTGGRTFEKPTHFGVTDGQFLDKAKN